MKIDLKREIVNCIEDIVNQDIDIENDYCSVLEYLDGKFDRDFYKRIDANELIHERMRYELNETGLVSTVGCWLTDGIMECYDFVHNTNDKDCMPNNGSTTDNIYDDFEVGF